MKKPKTWKSRIKRYLIKYPFVLFILLFFFAARPVEFGEEKSFFHGYAIAQPVIRVAIGRQLSEARITASSGMKVYEVCHQYRLLAAEASEILGRGEKVQLSEKFLVQAAQAESRQEAEKLVRDLSKKVPGRIVVVEDFDRLRGRRFFSVRYGDFLTRGEALAWLKTLNQAGITEAWIVREEVARPEKNAFWALVDDQLLHFAAKTTLYIIPANEWSYLTFNGTAYRGMFILQSQSAGLQVINVLNLEDYLKGVVPMELSPRQFGELEALKAQAVAARTYAFRNLGLMAAEGFDLNATPEHQAYGGMSAEHPLSNQAVDATKSEGLFYRGQPINALYTSTCGGMTEEGSAVFGGSDLPYLKATECVEERLPEYRLETSRQPLHLSLGPRDITKEISWLMAAGIVNFNSWAASLSVYLNEPAQPEELTIWVEATGRYLSRQAHPINPLSLPAEPLTPLIFGRYLIDYLGWRERSQNLLLESEVNYLLRDFSRPLSKDLRPLAYLIREGFLPSTPGLAEPGKVMTRGEILFTLARIMQKEKPAFRSAKFKAKTGPELKLEVENETLTFTLSPQAFLFREMGGEVSPASSLSLLGGEEVLFWARDGEVVWLELQPTPSTNVLDRNSAYSQWQVRLSREELSRRVNEYYPVGEVEDLRVLRRGQSHRVLEMEIIGHAGKAVVRGLRVRWVLGLRDTLFTVDREWEGNGQVGYFVFTGRGWGHGVGLCQVGAYGLAQRGATYRHILNKYYPGTKIGKLY